MPAQHTAVPPLLAGSPSRRLALDPPPLPPLVLSHLGHALPLHTRCPQVNPFKQVPRPLLPRSLPPSTILVSPVALERLWQKRPVTQPRKRKRNCSEQGYRESPRLVQTGRGLPETCGETAIKGKEDRQEGVQDGGKLTRESGRRARPLRCTVCDHEQAPQQCFLEGKQASRMTSAPQINEIHINVRLCRRKLLERLVAVVRRRH